MDEDGDIQDTPVRTKSFDARKRFAY